MAASKATSSSRKAHHGSQNSSTTSSHNYSYPSSAAIPRAKPIDRYVAEERDYKSYTVQQYDAFQEEARRRHEQQLLEVFKESSLTLDHRANFQGDLLMPQPFTVTAASQSTWLGTQMEGRRHEEKSVEGLSPVRGSFSCHIPYVWNETLNWPATI
ncbi:hypothetical protein BP6252_11955 [Coleophoma cylindrospora]|uniref:Uncharacterized protein n=1 Tax=Coleophoma cylindrospora TaxID=1849047 RepID=A0A3D8QFD4_9HELO|nr:hypothetical protein BP6252_11955 [Coleophoma cylindrospora]